MFLCIPKNFSFFLLHFFLIELSHCVPYIVQSTSESYDNYAQYGYNSKIDSGAKNYYGAARRSGISGQWLYRSVFPLCFRGLLSLCGLRCVSGVSEVSTLSLHILNFPGVWGLSKGGLRS